MGIPITITQDVIERVEAGYIPIPETGCWIWEKSVSGKGYARMSIKDRLYGVNRVAWEIYRGHIPNGMNVLHNCDTPLCINPDHLFLGTFSDNLQDCHNKGRKNHPRGLTNEQAVAILAHHTAGISVPDIATKFSVGHQTVYGIVRGELYKDATKGLLEGEHGHQG